MHPSSIIPSHIFVSYLLVCSCLNDVVIFRLGLAVNCLFVCWCIPLIWFQRPKTNVGYTACIYIDRVSFIGLKWTRLKWTELKWHYISCRLRLFVVWMCLLVTLEEMVFPCLHLGHWYIYNQPLGLNSIHFTCKEAISNGMYTHLNWQESTTRSKMGEKRVWFNCLVCDISIWANSAILS